MTANTALLFGFLPRLTPSELLFAMLVFTGAICVLFNIRPVAVLGATLLLTIITFVDLLGMSPFLALMVILAAAFIRVIGTAGSLEDIDPELLAALAAIIDRGTTTRDDREDD